MKLLMLGSGSYKSPLSIRLIALAQHLSKQHEVTVVVPSADKYNDFKPEPRASLPGIKLVQPWQFATHSAMLNLLPYIVTSFIAILRARADVIYLYKPTPITILGIVPRFLFGTRVILDLDDLGSEVMKVQGQSALQYQLVAFCERVAMRYSSAVVVASTYLKDLVQHLAPGKPTLLLPNGVEPTDYTTKTQQPPRHFIYYFGLVNRLSLIETLLRAVPAVQAAVPEVKILIAGGGTALDEAKQLVKTLGIREAVTFTGRIPMLTIQDYTQFADIAICCQPDTPTVRAASNMKVFQYMAMASVPVVSDVGDLASYVQQGKAGVIVPPEDAPALATALIELLQAPNKRTALAKQARSQAETTYSWESLTNTLATFIQSTVTKKTR